MSKKSQLVILGNGFDLACGLHSRYEDFFNWKYSELEEKSIIKNFIRNPKTLKKSDITFWDIFFMIERNYSKRNPNWSNIEEAIGQVVSYVFYSKEGKWLRGYSNEGKRFIDKVNRKLAKQFPNTKRNEYLQEYYLNQLYKFEDSFEKYIGNEKRTFKIGKVVKNNNENIEYFVKVEKKLNNLISEAPNMEHYIFSFNYTIDLDDDTIRDNLVHGVSPLLYINDIYNIHGYVPTKIDNSYEGFHKKIIFGIDGSIISHENDLRLPFTKAYRVLENSRILNSLPKNVRRIDFYGHSLARADYSYFEAMFDRYKLLKDKLILCFHYGTFSYKVENFEKNLKIKMDQYANVRRLIEHYGKEHGKKNLFCKLLLENKIIFMPDEGARDNDRQNTTDCFR